MKRRAHAAGLAIARRLPPETAHRAALAALDLGAGMRLPPAPDSLATSVLGLDFGSPVGLAAGFDKNARAVGALMRAGFGFIEVGTVTPRPQTGNPRPRLFRLAPDRALINRLGFNNEGAEAAAARLRAARAANAATGGAAGAAVAARSAVPIGVNIGANRDSEDRIADYAAGVTTFAPLADYVAVNVSSPNTPGLRALQAGDELRRLLDRILETRARHPVVEARTTPVLVKIAPDLDDAEIAAIAAVLREAGADGAIATNTSLWRPGGLTGRHRGELGGLSGVPICERSTIVLARLAAALDGALPIVGVGGIASGADAFAKIAAGASLVQLYTGLVYQGLPLVADIHAHLAAECRRRGVARIADLVGCERDDWAARPRPM